MNNIAGIRNTLLRIINYKIMKKKISKTLIHQICMKKQEELIENFASRVNTIKEDVYDKTHSTSQTEDQAAGKVELLRNFEKELSFVRLEMEMLKSLKPSVENKKVESGAMVITNHLNFYISVSVEKIDIERELIYGISTKAPIYFAMEGLEKGNTFTFNNKTYEIEDVY